MSIRPAPLLDLTPRQTVGYFTDMLKAADCSKVDEVEFACREAAMGTQPTMLQRLESDWYQSLDQGQPDYTVYDRDAYLAEAFNCWVGYSRKYLMRLQRPKSYLPNGMVAELSDARVIVDLGNGVGFTTAALTQLFPHATVIGTNVPGSLQYAVAELMADAYGFSMVPDAVDVTGQVDLVWASEYFEHFYEPVDHLRHVVGYLSPSRMLTANTFTGRATGHFDLYLIDEAQHDGNSTARAFGAEMREHGYTKIATGIWNNKPAYWSAV